MAIRRSEWTSKMFSSGRPADHLTTCIPKVIIVTLVVSSLLGKEIVSFTLIVVYSFDIARVGRYITLMRYTM